ncbi:MAG: hypothetical protein Q9227_008149 [Pyrenula ochraceoflavens]
MRSPDHDSLQEPLLHTFETKDGHEADAPLYHKQKNFLCGKLRSQIKLYIVLFGVAVLAIGAAISIVAAVGRQSTIASSRCQVPVKRREWRTLSDTEKKDYLDAVVCLTKTPSVVSENQTLYDDFPFVHIQAGKGAHESALFLSWHRYFDWTLDRQNLSQAPIWDPILGFGGDGNLTGDRTVNLARCVIDGPFAGLQVLYYGDEVNPHCLSRGFRQGQDMKIFYSDPLQPDALRKLMSIEDYETFNLELEHDPVFFLHHTQLDRLWYQWQQTSLQKRLKDYAGASSQGSKTPASVSDLLEMGNLAPSVPVRDIMDTRDGVLCYEY